MRKYKRKLNDYVDKKDYVEIILTNNKSEEVGRALIDKCNVEKVKICRWSLSHKTTQGFVGGKNISMHKLLMGVKKGFVVDHINGNGLDNRMVNLRYATKSQNAMNQKGVSGITYLKFRPECPNWKKRWKVQLQCQGKKYSTHCYTKEEALKKRREFELKYFKEFAK